MRIEGACRVRFDEIENAYVVGEADLDHLGEPGGQIHCGQRRQCIKIADDERWLVEGADEVLALSSVDAGLAPDRGIDHSEQSRGHLNESYATQPGGCDEAREVGRGTSPDADDEVGPGEPMTSQSGPAVRGHVGGLRRLCIGHRQEQSLRACPLDDGRNT